MSRNAVLTRLTAIVLVLAMGAAACSGNSRGARPTVASTPLTADAVRQIAREEVARALASQAAAASTDCNAGAAVGRALPSVVKVEVRRPGSTIVEREGSGFAALAGGVVLTAAHVVGQATRVQIVTADGRQIAADVLKADPTLDLAALRAADHSLPPIRWADPASVPLGEAVRIIGFPLRRPDVTVTGGVFARRIPAADGRREELWTDADADPGNSGGPLLTRCGEALGVVVERQITLAVSTIAVGASTALPFAVEAAAGSMPAGASPTARAGASGTP